MRIADHVGDGHRTHGPQDRLAVASRFGVAAERRTRARVTRRRFGAPPIARAEEDIVPVLDPQNAERTPDISRADDTDLHVRVPFGTACGLLGGKAATSPLRRPGFR